MLADSTQGLMVAADELKEVYVSPSFLMLHGSALHLLAQKLCFLS